MPDVALFQRGWDIAVGQVYANYRLTAIEMSERSIVRYNVYNYPTKLVFEWMGSSAPDEKTMQQLFDTFNAHVAGVRIIRSASGRPYRCVFHDLSKGPPTAKCDLPTCSHVTMNYISEAVRISNAEASRYEKT